jgi:hypothetical protein
MRYRSMRYTHKMHAHRSDFSNNDLCAKYPAREFNSHSNSLPRSIPYIHQGRDSNLRYLPGNDAGNDSELEKESYTVQHVRLLA